MRLLKDEPMRNHCSFRIGGPAEWFAEPASEEELIVLRRRLWERGVEPVIIGSGTNLLVSDEGLRGMVIRVGAGLDAIAFDGGGKTVYAGAGIPLSRLALAARDRGLAGLEFAHGIPGSLGGGVMMNAGAYGGEMKDVVASVRYLDAAGEVRETTDPGFAYRRSRFNSADEPGCVILGATLRLTPGDPEEIGAKMRELMARRSASQPLEKPSAGSTFKRPEKGYAAALIDGAGLKGFAIGGAQVSEKHAGFVINTGNATCADVLKLMEHIQKTVEERFGVLLEPEVKILR